MEDVLLCDAGSVSEAFGRNAGQQLHGALHPHVHGEAVCTVQTVEQDTVRHFRTDAVNGHQCFAGGLKRYGEQGGKVEFAGMHAAGSVKQIFGAKACAQRSEILRGAGGKLLRCGKGIQRVRPAYNRVIGQAAQPVDDPFDARDVVVL